MPILVCIYGYRGGEEECRRSREINMVRVWVTGRERNREYFRSKSKSKGKAKVR